MKKSLLIILITVIAISSGIVHEAYSQSTIPSWIKTTAKWYGDSLIPERDFINALQYLINNKVIIIQSKQESKVVETDNVDQLLDPKVAVTKPRLQQCRLLYNAYQNMGEQQFKTYYSYKNYINECVKLYKEPVWNYYGPDRVEKLYERFVELREQAKANKTLKPSDPSIMTLSAVEVGSGKFFVKYNVCAGTVALEKIKVLVQSGIEAIQVSSSKPIFADTCRTYESQINAQSKDSIKTILIEQILAS